MLPVDVREFVSKNHLSTLSTFRRNGAIQLSIVLAGPYRDGVAFSTPGCRNPETIACSAVSSVLASSTILLVLNFLDLPVKIRIWRAIA